MGFVYPSDYSAVFMAKTHQCVMTTLVFTVQVKIKSRVDFTNQNDSKDRAAGWILEY